jgi:hypothetical protein
MRRKHMTNTNQQTQRSGLGVTFALSVAALAATIFPSPAAAQTFTLIEQPASHLHVFAPVDAMGQTVRLNAANVFCPTAVERVLFKFFDGDGVTLMEEIKSVACGRVASAELPPIDRTEGGTFQVYALIAVLPAPQRPGNSPRSVCSADPNPQTGPLVTSLELIGHGTGGGGGAGGPAGVVRQTLLAAVQVPCALALNGRFTGAWGRTVREERDR